MTPDSHPVISPNGQKETSQIRGILFISRSHPPVIGGMERVSYELIKHFRQLPNLKIKTIINHQGKKALPFFLPWALLKGYFSAFGCQVIHLSDAVLAPLGLILKWLHPSKKVFVTIHGLDITFGFTNGFYKKFNLGALKKLDGMLAVSEETKNNATKAGVSPQKIIVVPNGVNPEDLYVPESDKKDLIALLKNKFPSLKYQFTTENRFLLTLGRLAKRKGFVWFIENVLPKLPENIFYLIAGEGPEHEAINKMAEKTNVAKRVLLLGEVTEKEKKILLNTVDIFVQPNISVAGDQEGFGITLIEASGVGLPVVASNLEGIPNAIHNEENGFLVTPEEKWGFKEKIEKILDPSFDLSNYRIHARQFTEDHFSWKHIVRLYLDFFAAGISTNP